MKPESIDRAAIFARWREQAATHAARKRDERMAEVGRMGKKVAIVAARKALPWSAACHPSPEPTSFAGRINRRREASHV